MTVKKYTLHKDQKSDKWRLEKEGSDRARRTSDTKEDALKNLKKTGWADWRIRPDQESRQHDTRRTDVSSVEGP